MRVLRIGQTWGNDRTYRLLRDVRGLGVTYCAPSNFVRMGDDAPTRTISVATFNQWILDSKAELIAGPPQPLKQK